MRSLLTLSIIYQSVAFEGSSIWYWRQHSGYPSPRARAPSRRDATGAGTSNPARRVPSANDVLQQEFNDPLLAELLLNANETVLDWCGITDALSGLSIWKACLLKGRIPIEDDFSGSVHTASSLTWPPEPLFTAVSRVFSELQLPRFVLRHPDTILIVLLTLWRKTQEFTLKQRQAKETIDSTEIEKSNQESLDVDQWEAYDDNGPASSYDDGTIYVQCRKEEEQDACVLADSIAGAWINEWGRTVTNVQTMDKLFTDHNILSAFGWDDGIWQHSGWELLPQLQRQLASMPELRQLVQKLGRRPTAEQSGKLDKFSPRRLDPKAALGPQYDALQKSSIQGLAYSNSLSEMLPSEAVLLLKNQKASALRRRLFLAKKVESKLLSYELSGWTDVPSAVRHKKAYSTRLPSAPAGPIVLCLDTSFSMSGNRERLSKAVALACVSAAHIQKRECQVIAFSTETGVMETGPIAADKDGVRRLLEFLSHSFGGGTDVTGALKHALQTLHNVNDMAAADILLVTDGEIPDPPISEELNEHLDRLKTRTGLQVHGLLVGRNESIPLDKICTEVHGFLAEYEQSLMPHPVL